MPIITRSRTLASAVELVEENFVNNNAQSADIIILPPPPGIDSDAEDIDEDALGDDLPADIAGELEVILHDSDDEGEEPVQPPTKKSKGPQKPPVEWKKGELSYPTPLPNGTPRSLLESQPGLANLSPYQLFRRFFDADIIEFIVDQSELYAKEQKNNPAFRVTAKEMEIVLGIMLYSGYINVPYQRMFWENRPDAYFPLVSERITKHRFEEIKRYIHLADNSRLNLKDKVGKVTPFADRINAKLKQFGYFSEFLSIDEQMVPYYGHHTAKMYMAGKPYKFGYKLWVICSSDGFPYHFIIYVGKSDGTDGPLGMKVVVGLLMDVLIRSEPYLHQVFFDNFFTSYELMLKLSEMGFRATGTARENRLQKPELKDKKIFKKEPRGSIDVCSSERTIVCRWNDNQPVCVISNHSSVTPIQKARRFDRQKKAHVELDQPLMIHQYNKHMGGVDLLDRFSANNRPQIRSKKWWWPLFSNMLNMCSVASWRIHRLLHPDEAMSQIEFLRSVVIEMVLCESSITLPAVIWPLSSKTEFRFDGVNHIRGSEKSLLCKQCHRSKTTVVCLKCKIHLHKNECFDLYHQK